jgi:radical SAM superfamily enzyme YgiQ (UPF0313 family)
MRILLSTTPNARHPLVLQSDFRPEPSMMLPYIPIGLLSVSAATRDAVGVTPGLYELGRRIIDGSVALDASFYRSAAEDIAAGRPDMVGFMTENETYHHLLQISRELKRIDPSCTIVLGGPHASAVAEATLRRWSCVDYIVRGEGELTFPDLVRSVMDGGRQPVPGAWHRSRDGEVTWGGTRPLLGDLDALPYPAYELYAPDAGEEIFFEVGRGCPFQCTFCSTSPFWQRKHRVKGEARILAELLHVVELYGNRRMHFTHDLFTTNKAWVRRVCETLIDAGVPVRWTCSSRTDTVDRELLDLMGRAGCAAIYFGLESGSRRILQEIRKKIEVEHSFAILRDCLDVGITPNVGFIGGFPTEDKESFRETFDAYAAALEMGCAPVHFFQFTPFEDSTMMPSLEDRVCRGHFVDLPLGPEADRANRALIAADDVVFGAYHRPRQTRGVAEELIDGLEEFPTLVSAMVTPALAVARAVGGMLVLYERWIAWISKLNDARGAEAFRRCFGSPVHFADFLLEHARGASGVPAGIPSVIQVQRQNFAIAAREETTIATTMANYRTGLGATDASVIKLGTTLTTGDIVGYLTLPDDVEALLAADPPAPLPEPGPGPTYLLWQRVESGDVRLMKVDAFTYFATTGLLDEPEPVGNLLKSWATRAPTREDGDLFGLVEQLEVAAQHGLVRPVEPSR